MCLFVVYSTCKVLQKCNNVAKTPKTKMKNITVPTFIGEHSKDARII